MSVGKNIAWKRGKEKQYNLSYNTMAVWKIIKWGRKSRFLKMGVVGN